MRGTGAERPVRAMKSGKLDGAKGSRHPACPDGQPRVREEPSSHAKPFNKRLRRHRRRAIRWLGGLARREPWLFAHWHLLGVTLAAG